MRTPCRLACAGVLACALAAGAGPSGIAAQTPEPAAVTAEQFAALTWLEGRWRGAGGGYDGFWESYEFADDSTIVQRTWPDSTFTEPDGGALFRYRDGGILSLRPDDGSLRSVVVEVRGDTLRFEAATRRGSFYEWFPVEDGVWSAVLGSGERQVTYLLRRIEGG